MGVAVNAHLMSGLGHRRHLFGEGLDGVPRDEPGSFDAEALEELEQSWCTYFACKQATGNIIRRILAPV